MSFELTPRENLLSQLATAAVHLYGVIRVEDFVDVCNYYILIPTTYSEVMSTLHPLAKEPYSLYLIEQHFLFHPHFADDQESRALLITLQKGKPRHYPEKELFLAYAHPDFYEPRQPYDDLFALLTHHNLLPKHMMENEKHLLYLTLRELVMYHYDTDEILDIVEDLEIYEKANLDLGKLLLYIQEIIDHTRRWEHNGFTTEEISHLFRHPAKEQTI